MQRCASTPNPSEYEVAVVHCRYVCHCERIDVFRHVGGGETFRICCASRERGRHWKFLTTPPYTGPARVPFFVVLSLKTNSLAATHGGEGGIDLRVPPRRLILDGSLCWQVFRPHISVTERDKTSEDDPTSDAASHEGPRGIQLRCYVAKLLPPLMLAKDVIPSWRAETAQFAHHRSSSDSSPMGRVRCPKMNVSAIGVRKSLIRCSV